MSQQIDREEFYNALGMLSKSIDSGFDGVNRRLDGIGEKVEDHGQAIAVLEDRDTRDGPARWTGFAGIATGVATFLWQHFMGGKP